MRKTSIIILTYNHLDYTKKCIQSIDQYTKKNTFEIIVVDNHSTDDTRNWLKKQKHLKVIFNDQNLGFPKACNQGIKIANKENDILLLNNDTIVTENWLENLKICLNSSSLIGAVGPVCNQTENDQGCNFSYDDFDTMQSLAKKNNQSDQSRWEQKVFLIGFCLLMKREVINQIEFLDEEYTPGYVEDNDLSLRIIKQGYQLMLCHDSFIHHYLGTEFRKNLDTFYPILNKNRDYFMKKWGFSTFAFDDMKTASLKIVEDPKKILEFDCGIGPTMLKLKSRLTNSLIHGIEQDPKKAQIASHLGVCFSSLDEVVDHDYDCIMIGNLLERVFSPHDFLKKLKKYLNKHGSIVAEFTNVASIDMISSLLNQQFYFNAKEKLHHYTLKDMEQLLKEEGYQIDFLYSWYKQLSKSDEKIVELLKKEQPNSYEVVYYSLRFSKECN